MQLFFCCFVFNFFPFVIYFFWITCLWYVPQSCGTWLSEKGFHLLIHHKLDNATPCHFSFFSFGLRASRSFLLFQGSLILPRDYQCLQHVQSGWEFLNKGIIYVLDYEGHCEKIRFETWKCLVFAVVVSCSFCLSPLFLTQVCDTRGSDGEGDEEGMKLAKWFILALADSIRVGLGCNEGEGRGCGTALVNSICFSPAFPNKGNNGTIVLPALIKKGNRDGVRRRGGERR